MIEEYKPGTPKTERNRTIYEMRKDGATFSEIGRKYKIGVERVRQNYTDFPNFCPNCGSDNRPRKDGET